MKTVPKKILVVRNDKLGDFMLSFPAFALLKQTLPQTEIHALVPNYTQPLAEACTYIDQTILDPGKKTGLGGVLQLSRELRHQRYDAVITLFSTTRIGLCVRLSDIPLRIAPATKLAQVFYNKRLRQHRSRSEKPEYAYNKDLASYYLYLIGQKPAALPAPPYLHFDDAQVQALKQQFVESHHIDPDSRLIFIHPGSGGSAGNLSLPQFAQLGKQLRSERPFHIVISCGPDEEAQARPLAKLLADVPHVVYVSDQGLRRFAEHIQFADLFIGGSTGPLHIAGALDRPTAGFYTRRQSAIALRWQTLNAEDRRLAFSPPATAAEEDMQSIDLVAAARQISEKFLAP